MKKVTAIGGLLCSCVLTVSILQSALVPRAFAVTTPPPTTISVGETPPPSIAPNIIVTSIVGSSLPDYIELFNQADDPISLQGWSISFTIHDGATMPTCADVTTHITLPNAWLLSKKYLTLQRTNALAAGSTTVSFFFDPATLLTSCTTPRLATLVIVDSSDAPEQSLTIPAAEWSSIATTVAQHKQRGNSPSSTRAITGVFDTDYKIVTGAISLNSDPLYTPPADVAGLQILEILPNARSCSPLEIDPTCNDYIKLYNPTDQSVDLALYRLRIGTKGQSESITNTFTWGQTLDPTNDELLLPAHEYFMLATRNDGQPLSITDSGNYVWLEDAYGTTTYAPVVQYPDASSTTKVGQAWAYDGTTWQWTSAPEPSAPNYFPPLSAVLSDSTSTDVVSVLKPCADNQ